MPLGSGRTLCPALKSRPALLGQQTRTQRLQDNTPCLSAGRCPSAAGARCSGTAPGPAPGRSPTASPLGCPPPSRSPPGALPNPPPRTRPAGRRQPPLPTGRQRPGERREVPGRGRLQHAAPARRHPGAASGAGRCGPGLAACRQPAHGGARPGTLPGRRGGSGGVGGL